MQPTAARRPVALVTGGAVRVGCAISRALADAGYRLLVNYHSSAVEAEELRDELLAAGGEVIAVQADVSERSQVTRMLETALQQYGRVDLVVNNGTVSPAFVQVTLAGPGFDGSPADTRFVAWVTFRANTGQTVDSRGNVTGLSSAHQGEIHALFGDVMATIKIRIADPPESL